MQDNFLYFYLNVEYLGCLQFSTLMNTAVKNILYKYLTILSKNLFSKFVFSIKHIVLKAK